MSSGSIMYAHYIHNNFEIDVFPVDGNEYFRASKAAELLGYLSPKDTISQLISDENITIYKNLKKESKGEKNSPCAAYGDFKVFEKELHPDTKFINEAGLNELILSSNKPEAKKIKKWICCEVLPSIRRTGKYEDQNILKDDINISNNKIISIFDELHLREMAVNFLRTKYPNVLFTASLVGAQPCNLDTDEKRISAFNQGYTAGTPDIIIHECRHRMNGIVIELKTPKGNGVLRENQRDMLIKYKLKKYKIIVSNDFIDIVMQIIQYMN